MRKDARANMDRVIAALDSPATNGEVLRRTGMTLATVTRAIGAAIACGKAHQSGWKRVGESGKWTPIYSNGPNPEGFVLPPMPRGLTPTERGANWNKANPDKRRESNRASDRRTAARRKAEREERKRISAAVFGAGLAYLRKPTNGKDG
jgi:hypothetical protein